MGPSTTRAEGRIDIVHLPTVASLKDSLNLAHRNSLNNMTLLRQHNKAHARADKYMMPYTRTLHNTTEQAEWYSQLLLLRRLRYSIPLRPQNPISPHP